MSAFPRIILAFWLFLIFSFCVYGWFMTFGTPGESFCCSMYTSLTAFSALCIIQVLEPIRERA
jgi:hypothetical protein